MSGISFQTQPRLISKHKLKPIILHPNSMFYIPTRPHAELRSKERTSKEYMHRGAASKTEFGPFGFPYFLLLHVAEGTNICS